MSWQDGLAGDGERALRRPPIVEVGGLNFPVRQPRFREAGSPAGYSGGYCRRYARAFRPRPQEGRPWQRRTNLWRERTNPQAGQHDLKSVRPSLCRADGPNCTSIRFANLPRPKVEAGAFFHSWQRRTNLWRGRTNLRTGSERLRGVMRRLDPQALAFFGPGHPWWWHPRPQMLR